MTQNPECAIFVDGRELYFEFFDDYWSCWTGDGTHFLGKDGKLHFANRELGSADKLAKFSTREAAEQFARSVAARQLQNQGTSAATAKPFVRPEHCGASNEELECLGCGWKLGVVRHRGICGAESDYNDALARQPEQGDGWLPIDSAPKGCVTEDAGVRGSSEWFLGLRKDGDVRRIRRLPEMHGHAWADSDETFYVSEWFTHRQPLPKPPASP